MIIEKSQEFFKKPIAENGIKNIEKEKVIKNNNPENNNPEDSKKKEELVEISIAEQEETLEEIKALSKKSGLDLSDTIEDMQNKIGEMRNEIASGEVAEELSKKSKDKNEIIEPKEKVAKEEKSIEFLEKSTLFLKEKIKNSEFFDSVSSLANILRRREENDFYPLVDPKAIPYLVSAYNDMAEAIQSQKLGIEEINLCAKRICGAIDAIGRDLPRGGIVKEDTDVLSRVAFNLQNVEESSKKLMIELGGSEDKNLEESMKYFKKLTELSEERWSFIIKKRQILEGK